MIYRNLFLVIYIVITGILFTACSENKKSPVMEAPLAKIEAKEMTIHGDTRVDNYYWLNQRENPGIIAYLEAENAYTKSMMSHTDPFQEKLFNEIVGRIKQTDIIHVMKKVRNTRFIAEKKKIWMPRKKSC
jgi:oligopeptidase B